MLLPQLFGCLIGYWLSDWRQSLHGSRIIPFQNGRCFTQGLPLQLLTREFIISHGIQILFTSHRHHRFGIPYLRWNGPLFIGRFNKRTILRGSVKMVQLQMQYYVDMQLRLEINDSWVPQACNGDYQQIGSTFTPSPNILVILGL